MWICKKGIYLWIYRAFIVIDDMWVVGLETVVILAIGREVVDLH